jgi:TIGR03009 family protein
MARFRAGALLLVSIGCLNVTPALAQQAGAPAAVPPAAVPRVASQPAPAGPPAAQPAPQQEGEVRPQPPAQPPGPRQVTDQEAAFIDQVLHVWEIESDKVKSYKGPFERWEYDPVFGPKGIAKTKSRGMLKYLKPDKGELEITEARHYDAEKQDWLEKKGDVLEHWVCDGKAVYEYKAREKQLVVRNLPPAMQGTAIADGPLPFVFGAKKDKLKQRYYFNVTHADEKEIWLSAWPRFQRDAANFQHVELILNRQKFLPSAIQVFLPNGDSRNVYIFHLDQVKVNDPLDRFLGSFQSPRTPPFWKRVVEEPPAEAPAPQQPPQQAARPRPGGAQTKGPLR